MNRTVPIAFSLIFALLLAAASAHAAEKKVGVFVALVDNKTQGIAPVPARIGNGDDPEHNLYWGTDEGLKGWFDRSGKWKLVEKNDKPASRDILRTRTYKYAEGGAALDARAYRGCSMKQCILDFESAVSSGGFDLVIFVGHDGLMDFQLPAPARSAKQAKRPDCIVLACLSEAYFKPRIEKAGGRPVLLTTQLMYPGSFLVEAAVDTWLKGGSRKQIREAAGKAYARNQHISRRAGCGVFAVIKD